MPPPRSTAPPTCRRCPAPLARCWVCGEVARCAECQLCLGCEGLLDESFAGRARPAELPVRVPAVRLRRYGPPRAVPTPAARRPAPAAANRSRARPVPPGPAARLPLAGLFWTFRVVAVPPLMLLSGAVCLDLFHKLPAVLMLFLSVVGMYLPYLVLTPVRKPGDLFPLGDIGPSLPVVMTVGGAVVGFLVGVAMGLVGGLTVGKWVGLVVAAVVFHLIYYAAVAEKAKAMK